MAPATNAETVAVALNPFATLFVGLRAYSRFAILKKPSVDDYLIIIAVVLSWMVTAFIITQAQFGMGKHIYEVPPDDLKEVLQSMWASVLAYGCGLTFTKLSALFQFLRFCVTPGTRTAVWILITIVSAYGIAIPITSICSCLPVAFFWDRSIKNGKCIDLLPFWYFAAIFNIVTDIAIVVVPTFMLKDLRLPKRQKWAVMGIFAVGALTCIIAIIRMNSIFIIARSKDVTYDNVNAAIWSAAELNVAITCVCLPSLKPLVQKVVPKWLSKSSSTKNPGNGRSPRLQPIKLSSSVDTDLPTSNSTWTAGSVATREV